MRSFLASAILLIGCGPRVSAGEPEPDVDATEAGESGGEPAPADGSDGSDGDGSPSPETGGAPPAVCGDAVVEGDEECDDGNDAPADGCEANCQHSPGSLLWEYSAPAGFGFGLSLAVDDEDRIYVTGAQYSDEQDIRWTARLSADGLVDWEATEPMGPSVRPRDIVPTSDGGAVITSEENFDPEDPGEAFVSDYFWAHFDGEGNEVDRIIDRDPDLWYSPPPIISDGEGGFFTAPRYAPDEDLMIEHWSAFGELISAEVVVPPRQEPIAALALGLLDDGRLLMVGFEREWESPEGIQCAAEGWGKSNRFAAVFDTAGEIHDEFVLDDPEQCLEGFGYLQRYADGWIVPSGRSYLTFAADGTFAQEYGRPEIPGVEDFGVWRASVDSIGQLVLGGADGFPSWESPDAVVVAYGDDGEPRFTAIIEGHPSLLSPWGGTRIHALQIATNDDVVVAGYRTLSDGHEAELFIRRYAN